MNIDIQGVQKSLDWLKTKIFLDAIEPSCKCRIVKRGQVYYCKFGIGVGSEIQKERPAVIVQNNIGNIKSGNVIVVPITHKTITSPFATAIADHTNQNGDIILNGYANAASMTCVSKARLGDYICTLSSSDIKNIDIAIAKELGIISYYSELSKKLEDKIQYIERIKEERNAAQDELAKLRLTIQEKSEEQIVKSDEIKKDA